MFAPPQPAGGTPATRRRRSRRAVPALVAVLAVVLVGAPVPTATASHELPPVGRHARSEHMNVETSAGPSRLLDTRIGGTTVDGQMAGGGPRPSGSTTVVPIAGRGGSPANATAVIANVTAVDASQSGYVTLFACDSPRPEVSTLNYGPGSTVANLALVKVSAAGTLCIYNLGTTDLLLDVTSAAGTDVFTPLPSPARLADTRPGASTIDGQQLGTGQRPSGSTLSVQVSGRAGVPAGSSAVVLNVTATAAQASGFLTVFACGTNRPLASNVNYTTGATAASAVFSRIGADGTICVYNEGATDVVVDIFGTLGSGYQALSTPQRLVDTRSPASTVDGDFAGIGSNPAAAALRLHVAGRGGIPANASAVLLSVTAVDPVEAGYVTAHPAGAARPNASNLNHPAGATVANAVVAGLGAGGDVCLFTSAQTDLVIDVAGWFTGPAATTTDAACPSAPAAIDVSDDGSIFGLGPVQTIPAGQVISVIASRLGSPTTDSLWQPMPSGFACAPFNSEYRVLWWGDLRVTLERGVQGEQLTAWSVGDPAAGGIAPAGALPAATSPTGITTREGIGLGASRSSLLASVTNRGYVFVENTPTRVNVVATGRSTGFVIADETVVGIGGGRFECFGPGA